MSAHLSVKSDLGLQSDSFLDDDYFSPENIPSVLLG
jgi:hypothetical protein